VLLDMVNSLVVYLQFIWTLLCVRWLTFCLHIWIVWHGGNELSDDELERYKILKKDWDTTQYKWDLEAYRFHPAWRHRYLHSCCYNYAQVYAKVYKSPMEFMIRVTKNAYDLVHVYNIKRSTRYQKTRVRCLDLDHIPKTRQQIKNLYGVQTWKIFSYHKPGFVGDDKCDEKFYVDFTRTHFLGELFALEQWMKWTRFMDS